MSDRRTVGVENLSAALPGRTQNTAGTGAAGHTFFGLMFGFYAFGILGSVGSWGLPLLVVAPVHAPRAQKCLDAGREACRHPGSAEGPKAPRGLAGPSGSHSRRSPTRQSPFGSLPGGSHHRQDAGPQGLGQFGPCLDDGLQVGIGSAGFRFNCPRWCPHRSGFACFPRGFRGLFMD